MKKLYLFTALFFMSWMSTNAQTSLFDTVLNRYRDFLYASERVPADSIKHWLMNLNDEGQWRDINYKSDLPGGWPAIQHLNRVKQLAIYWGDQKSSYYRQPVLLTAITAATRHWLARRYQNPNWWQNQIGVPQYMRDIIVLLRKQRSAADFKGAMEVLQQYQLKGTGANLVWSADLALHDAALKQDSALLKKSSLLIAHEIMISRGDGIQPDYSYHQHGARLQTYHYGGSFIKDNIRLAWQLKGTPWALPSDKINILVSFVKNGWQWMARGKTTVPGTIDRAVSRKGFLASADLTLYLPYLRQLSPQNALVIDQVLKVQQRNLQTLEGYRSFPYSDFYAYQQKSFSFFLKAISTRTEVTENINGENKKGAFLNFGDSYLVRSGSEYTNLMPVWDWTKLPGQTNFDGAVYLTRTPFSGGVTDGNVGAAAMDLASANTTQQFIAYKFWASYKNTIITLIADAKVTGAPSQIRTTLNQSRWQGNVTVNQIKNVLKSGRQRIGNVKWLHHDGFAYIPITPVAIDLLLDTVNGRWSSINNSGSNDEVITEKIFMPVIDHGNHSSIEYAVINADTPQEAQRLALKPTWQVVSNSRTSQAVLFENKVLLAVFRTGGTLTYYSNNHITVSRPCMVMIANGIVYAADPLHKGSLLTIRINNKEIDLSLPDDGTTTFKTL